MPRQANGRIRVILNLCRHRAREMTVTATIRRAPTNVRPGRHEGCSFRANHPDFVQEMQRLQRRWEQDLKRLGSRPKRDRHGMVRHLLTQKWVLLLYAYKGLRSAKRLSNKSPEEVRALAAQCNPYHPPYEPVTTQWIKTPSGRPRAVANFGPLKRAHQMLVADLLRHSNPPLEQQFMFRGGTPAAFRAVEGAYAAGFTFAAEVDFIDFYGSVRLDGLAYLLRPLPPCVVEHVVWDRSVRGVDHDDDVLGDPMAWAYPSLNGQTGLALGSCSSPMAAERIIASLLPDAPTWRTVTYADNVLVLGRSCQDVEACFDLMQRNAERHNARYGSGWSLGLRMDGISDITHDTFQFLHHEGTRTDDGFSWAPDQRKLGQFMAAQDEVAMTLEDIGEIESKIAHWRRAYPQWPEGDLWEVQQLAALAARRFYIDASPLHKSQAAHALVASYFASGRLQTIDELAPSGVFAADEERRSKLIEAAERRLITFARRARVGRDAIRYLG